MVREEDVLAVRVLLLAVLWQGELALVVLLVQRREDVVLRRVVDEDDVLLLLGLLERGAEERDGRERDEGKEGYSGVALVVWPAEAGTRGMSVVAVVYRGGQDVVLRGPRVPRRALAEHGGLVVARVCVGRAWAAWPLLHSLSRVPSSQHA
ncbi:uncharacterized protein B0H18DRAFT_1005965 [Fomitopsis serialis]|uniref:uncharacterized protein n=1 Tax=Fomitopsis serialis TaxID=139415 RepID=UPI002007CF4B|nr:uncharacterized protein B0H18DRAFT_1005965 [Neoantrodia serialis]KAH9926411.1 hypothetical protein B0H18DRAFT_1005965 [Neoantrodia serialis]